MEILTKDNLKTLVGPLWLEGKIEVIDQYFSDDVEVVSTFLIGVGKAVMHQNVAETFKLFPDFTVEIIDIMEQGSKIIYKWQGRTNQVKEHVFSGMVFAEINNGLITRYHSYSDILQVASAEILEPPQLKAKTLNIAELIILIQEKTGARLSNRECETLCLWLRGASMKQTARALGDLSYKTIQTFRENIKNKLKVKTYEDLISLITLHSIGQYVLSCIF